MHNSLQSRLLLSIMTFLFALPCSLFSQISISKDDILGLIGTVQQTMEVDTTASTKTVDVGTAAGSQNWDFDSIVLGVPFTFTGTFVDAASTPFSGTFPTANVAQKLLGETDNPLGAGTIPLEAYNYFQITDDGLASVGVSARALVSGILWVTVFVSKSTSTPSPLPVTFGQTWLAMGRDTTETQIPEQATAISSHSATKTVDAWGTALVGGKNIEALRICSFDTMIVAVFDGDGNQIEGPDTLITIDYSFATQNNGFIAQLTSKPGETDPNFNSAIAVIRVTDGIITAVEEFPGNGVLPTTFDLSQNYPNPFNPETKIRFSVGKAGDVELAVFDLQGRLVRTLVNREMPVGNHAISWDGTDTNGQKVASGRYIYRLSANGVVKSKMMVLIK